VEAETRRRRLVERHIRFGKTPEAAADWVERSDEANARAIRATRERADLVVQIHEDLLLDGPEDDF
jgi:pantothenate kinase